MSAHRHMAAAGAAPHTVSPLLLLTLGEAALLSGSGSRPVLGPGKPLALLTYLDALSDHRVSREHLTALLWADAEPVAARHALRQTIWYLRKQLGPEAFASSPDVLELTAPLSSDRAQFLIAIEAGRLDDAVAAYRGEFLPGFAVAGGAGFEHWADAERQRLRFLFQRAAESLTREALKEGRMRRARGLARRVRDAAPLDERGWRLLIETCLAQGDRVSAVAEGQRLRDLLAVEHRELEPATREMLRRADRLPQPSAAPDDMLAPDLVGREREFAAILGSVERARQGTGRVVQVTGNAGLGKTRLLRDVGRRCAAGGACVIYVRAHPADRDVAWGYLAELVRELAGHPGATGIAAAAAAVLVAVEPSLSGRYAAAPDPATGEEAHRRRLTATAELVRAVSEERMLVLLLDDLHWCDPASRAAVEHLAGRLRTARVLLVLAARPTWVRTSVEPSAAIHLEPLTCPNVEALLATLGSLPDEPWATTFPDRLCRATGGSPLLVLETLHLTLESECLALDDASWICRDPARLHQLVEAGSALSRRIEQLDADERRLLLLLALAGGPVSLDLAAAASGGDRDHTHARLSALEKRGFVVGTDAGWSAMHDEIAAETVDLATTDERLAAHGELGTALLANAGHPATLKAAARHLHAASQAPGLREAAARWVRAARARGDARPAAALVADLLGGTPEDPDIRRTARSLPGSLRYRRSRMAALLAGGLAALALLTVTVLPGAPASGPDVLLALWEQGREGGWRLSTREVTDRDIAHGVIDVASFRRTAVTAPEGAPSILRPGTRTAVASTRAHADSGGLDVVLTEDGSRWSRLTARPGDDLARAWSPDGRYLVVATDRWTDRSRTDLAVLDPAYPDSVVARLTRSPEYRDERPVWSPDGTRIAFIRVGLTGRRYQLCLVTQDGRRERCLDHARYELRSPVGWANAAEVLAHATDSAGRSTIVAFHTATGEARELAHGVPLQLSHAPGWLACYCRRTPDEPFQTLVIPTARPDRAVRLEPGDPPPRLTLFPARATRTYLERLTIVGAAGRIPLDGSYRLTVSGRDAVGAPLEPFAVRWHVTDTTIATIDSSGLVRPRAEGRTTVIATAGGWRADSTAITVGPARTTAIVHELWDDGIAPRWMPFGTPRPSVADLDGSTALAPNGDSAFASGVYLRAALPTREGVGVELTVSTPQTRTIWQRIIVELISRAAADPASWDHRRGALPLTNRKWLSCTVTYPAAESEWGWDTLSVSSGFGHRVAAPASMRTGAWTRLRIQLFPDGRCGFAVNGEPRAFPDRRVPMGDSLLLLISSASHGTRFLVGPVEVWSGVRRDVDWDTVEP